MAILGDVMRVWLCPCQAWHVGSRQGTQTALVVGTVASSRTRSGIESGSGMASLVEMRRDMTWSVLAVFVTETTYTVGVAAASMLHGGMVF